MITSTKPTTLGKCYRLRDGKLTKTVAGEMVTGKYEIKELSNVEDLARLLSSIGTDQAIMASLPANRSGR